MGMISLVGKASEITVYDVSGLCKKSVYTDKSFLIPYSYRENSANPV